MHLDNFVVASIYLLYNDHVPYMISPCISIHTISRLYLLYNKLLAIKNKIIFLKVQHTGIHPFFYAICYAVFPTFSATRGIEGGFDHSYKK